MKGKKAIEEDVKICLSCNKAYKVEEGKLDNYCDYCTETCKECGEPINLEAYTSNGGYCVRCSSKITKTCYYCKNFGDGGNVLVDDCYLLSDKIDDIELYIENEGKLGNCKFWLLR